MANINQNGYMDYQLNCEWCGLPFFSNQPHTRFCCDKCAKLYSKQKYRQFGIDALEAKISAQTSDTLREGLRQKDVLTTPEAAIYLGVCKTTVSRYVALGMIPVIQLPGKNLYRRSDLDEILSADRSAAEMQSTMNNESSELTTVASAAKKYGISATSLYATLTSSNVSPIQFANITYFRKSDITEVLGKSPLKDSIKPRTWASHEQIELEYRMTRTAVTRMLRELSIPSKRVDRVTYFSMDHLRARKKAEEDKFSELYYTVPQIVEKYSLKEQRVYKILHKYKVKHFKSGVTVTVLREEFDRVFGIPEFTL